MNVGKNILANIFDNKFIRYNILRYFVFSLSLLINVYIIKLYTLDQFGLLSFFWATLNLVSLVSGFGGSLNLLRKFGGVNKIFSNKNGYVLYLLILTLLTILMTPFLYLYNLFNTVTLLSLFLLFLFSNLTEINSHILRSFRYFKSDVFTSKQFSYLFISIIFINTLDNNATFDYESFIINTLLTFISIFIIQLILFATNYSTFKQCFYLNFDYHTFKLELSSYASSIFSKSNGILDIFIIGSIFSYEATGFYKLASQLYNICLLPLNIVYTYLNNRINNKVLNKRFMLFKILTREFKKHIYMFIPALMLILYFSYTIDLMYLILVLIIPLSYLEISMGAVLALLELQGQSKVVLKYTFINILLRIMFIIIAYILKMEFMLLIALSSMYVAKALLKKNYY